MPTNITKEELYLELGKLYAQQEFFIRALRSALRTRSDAAIESLLSAEIKNVNTAVEQCLAKAKQ